MAIIKLTGYQCDRCGHEWTPRLKTEEEPAMCPKCKSAYWNKPRRIDLARDSVKDANESIRQKKNRKGNHL